MIDKTMILIAVIAGTTAAFILVGMSPIEGFLVGDVVAGVITAMMQIRAEMEEGAVVKDLTGVNPYDYLFKPMPRGTFNPWQPYKRAFWWILIIIGILGFGWVYANVPYLRMLAMFYIAFAIIVAFVILIEDINPVKADMTACMLWGYGKYEDQVITGIIVAMPFILLGITAQIMPLQVQALQIEGMPIASFILTVIMIPLVEESFFRGFIAASIAEQAGIIHGALVSAFFFAVFHAYTYHLNWVKIAIAFAFGAAAAFADFKYKSILPGLVAHMMVNFMAFMSLLPYMIYRF